MHKCYAEGCRERIVVRLLMCRRHWRLVPKPLREEVNRCWRLKLERSHWHAIQAARAAVAAAEAT